MTGIHELDRKKLGDVLLTVSVISRQLGHETVAGTVRSYLVPHGAPDAEHEFVYSVLAGSNPVTEDEAIAVIRQRQWTEPA